jgi:hypothetical protein
MAKRNYSKISTKPEVEQTPVTEPETVEESIAPTEPEEIKEIIGVVTGCGKLNVRQSPSVSADVLCEVSLKTELVIDLDRSNDGWFSVCTPAGIEGFCMRKFVEVKQ